MTRPDDDARLRRQRRARATERLFVALYPPPDVSRALLDGVARLDLPPHNPTPASQVHLTALFVGEVSARDLPAVAESVERAAAGVGAFELQPSDLVALPQSGPARLLAARLEAPSALLELRRRLVVRLAWNKRKVQTFLPHLTLARFLVATAYAPPDGPLGVPGFEVTEVALMRSHLTPDGAEHRRLSGASLR